MAEAVQDPILHRHGSLCLHLGLGEGKALVKLSNSEKHLSSLMTELDFLAECY